MLENSFYSIISQQDNRFHVRLLPDCPVYQGHFPGRPVSPGVCSVQMVKELAEKLAGHSLFLSDLRQVRFRTLLTPATHPELDIVLNIEPQDNKTKLTATVGLADELFVELKATLDITD